MACLSVDFCLWLLLLLILILLLLLLLLLLLFLLLLPFVPCSVLVRPAPALMQQWINIRLKYTYTYIHTVTNTMKSAHLHIFCAPALRCPVPPVYLCCCTRCYSLAFVWSCVAWLSWLVMRRIKARIEDENSHAFSLVTLLYYSRDDEHTCHN